MNTGICPILSRYVTDLYLTLPEEFSDQIKAQETDDMWNVSVDPVYIDKRMYLCADTVTRVLLPIILDAVEPLKGFSQRFRDAKEIIGVDYMTAHQELVDEAFDLLQATLEKSDLPESTQDELAWMQDVLFATRWVIEAALCGSAVIGPLTVNFLDILSEAQGWKEVIPHALTLMERMRKIEKLVN
jgi:hypothetical protein